MPITEDKEYAGLISRVISAGLITVVEDLTGDLLCFTMSSFKICNGSKSFRSYAGENLAEVGIEVGKIILYKKNSNGVIISARFPVFEVTNKV